MVTLIMKVIITQINNCDSIVTLDLTINNSDNTSSSVL